MIETLTNITKLREAAAGEYEVKTWKLLHQLLIRVQSFVPDENIKVVYLKQQLLSAEGKKQDEPGADAILFTKDQIIITEVVDDGKDFEVNIYRRAEISNICVKGKLTTYEDDAKQKAIIYFKDGKTLKLSSTNDANEGWQSDYSKLISSIVKLLTE